MLFQVGQTIVILAIVLAAAEAITDGSSANTNASSTSSDSGSTSPPPAVSVHERSLDSPREGRILNDDKISIKGFIPIVGLSGDSGSSGNNNNNDKKNQDSASIQSQLEQSFIEKYFKNMQKQANNGDNGDPQAQQQQYPQHVAQPEDQRFFGAALQGLLSNVNSLKQQKQQGFRRGGTGDCVCVPFYMCKNGFVVEGASDYSLIGGGGQQQRKSDAYGGNNNFEPIAQGGLDPSYMINERSLENKNEVSGKDSLGSISILIVFFVVSTPNRRNSPKKYWAVCLVNGRWATSVACCALAVNEVCNSSNITER